MAYGWTPQQMGEMTLAQVFVYYLEAKDAGSNAQVKQSELAETQKRIRYQRQQWEAALWYEVNRG